MKKILTVAWNEYRNVVFTKSFIIGLFLPIVIYGGMILIMVFASGTTDLSPRKLVVVDRTGEIEEALKVAVMNHNRGEQVFNAQGQQIGPRFEVEYVDPAGQSDTELEIALSDRVRSTDLFAFAIIGSDYLSLEGGKDDYLAYYSNSPTFNAMPWWLAAAVKDRVEAWRMEAAGLDPRETRRIFSHNELQRFNLAEQAPDGSIVKPKAENEIFSAIVPVVAVLMLFMAVQMVTPVLLSSIIEEKMQRIAELLLSNLTAMQLLWGKLLAGVSVGLTFSIAYTFTALTALAQFGRADYLPVAFLPFFFLFLLVTLLTFGALLGGISAACQDLKDSQNMAGSVIMLLVVPMVLSMAIVGAPESTFARVMSFIPPFSPMIMTLRLAIPPGPMLWEPVLALVINLTFAAVAVWAGARVFRIGILAQGTTPGWKELMRWVLRG